MQWKVSSFVVAAAALSACGEQQPEAPKCLDDMGAPGDVEVFLTLPKMGSEGIAFGSEGQLFVTNGDDIVEVKADRTTKVIAQVPSALGMAVWGKTLYVTSLASKDSPVSRPGAIYKIENGEATRWATGITAPNFLTVTPWGSMLVSDDRLVNSTIYEVNAAGLVTPWATNVPSANGMAFNLANDSLFVATTFVDPPPLMRVAVSGGKAGAVSPVTTYEGGTAPDGVAFDLKGNLYVALNTKGEIHKVGASGKDEIFATDLFTPASLAFGNGAGFDPCSAYVTSLFGDKVYRVRVGEPGAALPPLKAITR